MKYLCVFGGGPIVDEILEIFVRYIMDEKNWIFTMWLEINEIFVGFGQIKDLMEENTLGFFSRACSKWNFVDFFWWNYNRWK